MTTQNELQDQHNRLFELAVSKLRAAQLNPVIPCKICGEKTCRPFDILDFNKSCESSLYPIPFSAIPVIYHRCENCNFIFTNFFDEFTDNEWRSCVYNDDYIKVDPDYKEIRPKGNAENITSILCRISEENKITGLDYGGGNGNTALMVREKGYPYDSYDPFGHTSITPGNMGSYNFCTAFEVFEHTPNPVGTLENLLGMASRDKLFIYLSTTVHDDAVSDSSRLAWSYAGPRNGHISLYSRKSLKILAGKFNLDYHSAQNKQNTHILTRNINERQVRSLMFRRKPIRKIRSLLNLKTSLFG
jgi:hypothetical protein